MIKVDTPTLEQCLDLGVAARSSIYSVFARIVLVSCTSYHKLRIGHDLERIGTRLQQTTGERGMHLEPKSFSPSL